MPRCCRASGLSTSNRTRTVTLVLETFLRCPTCLVRHRFSDRAVASAGHELLLLLRGLLCFAERRARSPAVQIRAVT